jgi:hypothetical protein
MKRMVLRALVAAPLLILGGSNGYAAALVDLSGTHVDFVGIQDAVPGGLFDAAASTVTGDALSLGLDAFKADSNSTVSDVMSFTIKAKPEQFITSVKYREAGGWSIVGPAGFVSASANWSVGTQSGVVGTFFLFGAGNSGTWATPSDSPPGTPQYAVINFAPSEKVTELYVSIANILSAAAPTGASASVFKDMASLEVEAVPVPPAVWLLGSALFGMGVLGRRGTKAAA